jgi:hypothetical protein
MKPEQKHHNEEPESGPHTDHPAKEDLVRFMAGDLPPAEARAVVRHLLRGCPICSRKTSKVWSLGDEPLVELVPAPGHLRQVGVWR